MKRIRLFLVLMATVLSSLSSMAHDFEVDGIYYNITPDTTVAVTYRNYNSNEYVGNVIIPETVTYNGTTYFVTSIGDVAFSGCTGLTSVTIPSSLTSIGYCAFSGCSGLTEVTIPSSLTSIGYGVFSGCSGLTEVNFNAENCRIINSYIRPVFEDCSNLKKLNIGNNVKNIPDRMFEGCSGLTSVSIGNSVTSIGNYAFSGCTGLTSVIIPNSLTSIGHGAFSGCSGLTEVTIPSSLTSIGHGVFSGCTGLTELVIEDGTETLSLGYNSYNSGEGLFHDCPLEKLYLGRNLSYSTSSEHGYSPFYNISELKLVTIGNSVTSIGDNAFHGCSGLTSVTIPNSVTEIETYAFSGCSGLTSVTIPNSVTEIETYAFSGCSGLTSVTIPNSVTVIGTYAFSGCSGLTSVTIPNSVTEIETYAFSGCSGLTSVTIPKSVTTIGNNAFGDCRGIKELRIEDSNEGLSLSGSGLNHSNVIYMLYLGRNIDVADYFNHNDTLKEVTIGDSVTTIGNYAFYCCYNLTSVTIGNSVTSIGDNAFHGCSSLTSVTIGNSVTTIGNSAFYDCSRLTSVTIPNSVTTIENDAFDECHLTELVIEDGTETLSLGRSSQYRSNTYYYGLFFDCRLKKVYLGRNLSYSSSPDWGWELEDLIIGDSVTEIGDNAFLGCSSLTSVTIGNSVTTIGNSAFYDCSRLTSVTIPNSVTTIGNSAFNECSGLTSVTIGNSVTTIGSNAFNGCDNLTKVKLNCDIPPSVDSENFANIKSIHVNKKAIFNYVNDEYWKNFGIIYATEGEKTYVPIKIIGFGQKLLSANGYTEDFVECVDNDVILHVPQIAKYAYLGERDITDKLNDDKSYKFKASIYHNENVIKYFSSTNEIINVDVAGTLINKINVDSIGNIIALKLTGDLNGTDILTIRKMKNLKLLDMSDANIVNGGINYTTSKDLINPYFFSSYALENSLEVLLLPKTITSINGDAFSGLQKLWHVVIPSAVTSIGYCFDNCPSLQYLIIEDNVDNPDLTRYRIVSEDCPLNSIYVGRNIGNAFKGNKTLKNIKIGHGVSNIECGAYGDCPNLVSLSVSEKNTNYDSRDNCNAIIETASNTLILGIKTTEIPKTVTKIGKSAFLGCTGLTSVTIPNSITKIEESTFQNCSGMTSLTIPNSVDSIGISAFSGCSGLKELYLNDGTNILVLGGYDPYYWQDGCGFYDCPLETLYLGRNIGNDHCPFAGKSTIKTLTISDSVTSIREREFFLCTGLTSVTIGNSVTTIGNSAFNECSGLTSVTIPNSVTSIGNNAFNSCSGLTSVTIGNSVTNIGEAAFSHCRNLVSVDIPNSVKSIGNDAFSWCESLISATIGKSVTTIGNSAFYGCSNLASVAINNSAELYVGEDAFYGCSSMASIEISDLSAWCEIYFKSKTSHPGGRLILNGSPIYDLVIPDNVVHRINPYAFYGHQWFSSVTINQSVSNYAFGYTSIDKLIIGNRISIGENAFYNVNEIYSLSKTPPSIYSSTFANVDKQACNLYVPVGCKNIYWVDPYWGQFFNIIEIDTNSTEFEVNGVRYGVITPEGIVTTSTQNNKVAVIANPNMYAGNIFIPEMVRYLTTSYDVIAVNDNAFSGCVDLASVTLPASLETVGNGAFGGCSGLKEITAMGTIPADASETAFSGVDKNMCVLYVPFGCREVYANAPVWEEFYNIVEKAGIGGVEDIAADGAESVGVADGRLVVNTLSPTPVIVYTMSGSVVFNGYVDGERYIELPRGFYIVRLGAESKKISL